MQLPSSIIGICVFMYQVWLSFHLNSPQGVPWSSTWWYPGLLCGVSVDDNGKYIVIIYIPGQSITIVCWLILGIVCLVSGNKTPMSIRKMLHDFPSFTIKLFIVFILHYTGSTGLLQSHTNAANSLCTVRILTRIFLGKPYQVDYASKIYSNSISSKCK